MLCASVLPILAAQSGDAPKFTQIARDDDQATASSVACNQGVVRADLLALLCKCRADFSRVRRGIGVKWQNAQSLGEIFDGASVFRRPCRFLRTVKQFRQNDGRNAQSIGIGIEALAQAGRPVAQDADAEISVEQVAQHSEGLADFGGGLVPFAQINARAGKKVIPG